MFGIATTRATGTFQITIHDSAEALRLRIAGCLAARDVCEAESCWRTAASTMAGRRFVVDLTALSSVDAEGRELLVRMYAEGAEFVTQTPELNAIVGEITGNSPHPGALPRRRFREMRYATGCHSLTHPSRAAATRLRRSSENRSVSLAEGIAVSALALGFLACLIALAWTTGVTVDEPSHFLSGRLFWEGRDNLRPGDVPPLMKLVSGWVPLVMGARLPPASHQGWKDRDEWMLALVMVDGMNASEARRNFFLARLPMLIFPLGCCLLIWWWGRQMFSPWAAVAAATVFCLSPTVLGHGALVKNDLAASFGYLLFWYRAWRYWREPTSRNAGWLGAGLLCGLLAKYSMAILLPIAPLVILARCAVRPRLQVRELVRSCAVLVVVVYAGILAAWQFRTEPLKAEEIRAWKSDPAIPKLVSTSAALASAIPTPAAFWRGGMSLVSSNGGASAYFMGRTIPGGHPLYFLAAFAVKTPVAIQFLLGTALLAAAVMTVRGRLRPGDWCWLLPGFLYLGLASCSGLQLGIRLVLPSLTLFALVTAKAFELGASRKSARIAGVVLLAWLAGETAAAYPHYISYFNSWVGDPWRGMRILSDSNIDWGQDLRALSVWHRTSGIKRLTLSYFGTDNVFAYFNDGQIECLRPPWGADTALGRTRINLTPGHYAISATLITGQFFAPEYRDYYAVFRKLKPTARVGSIFIYYSPGS